MDYKITGSLIQAYIICPRQAWLMSRNITGNQHNDFLAIGRLLSEETYKRDKKEIMIGNNKIDVIKSKDNSVTIIEVKKSSRMISAGKMQLLFYMYNIRNKVKNIKGEIRIPKEKKVIPLELTEKEIDEIEKLKKAINSIIENEKPPVPNRLKYCKTCSHNDFCWS